MIIYQISRCQVKPNAIPIASCVRECQRNFLRPSHSAHGIPDCSRITSDYLPLAVDNYLRRIHAIKTELVGVPELPFAEYARRIRIDPTVAVPIINMFAENN